MSRIWKSATALFGAAMLTTVVASPAAAGCVDPPSLLSKRGPAPLLHLPGTGSPAFGEGQESVGRDQLSAEVPVPAFPRRLLQPVHDPLAPDPRVPEQPAGAGRHL